MRERGCQARTERDVEDLAISRHARVVVRPHDDTLSQTDDLGFEIMQFLSYESFVLDVVAPTVIVGGQAKCPIQRFFVHEKAHLLREIASVSIPRLQEKLQQHRSRIDAGQT